MKKTYLLLTLIGVVFFVTTFFASGIVGSYIINDSQIERHIIFTKTPIDTTNISDVDKILYSFKISIYPYLSVLSLFFLSFINFYFYRSNRRSNTLN
ncbi:hypothetical protein [Anaerobacillus sp. 1_MG-2023]|uniref:hypothetical protein n=1 Tax=Anaerobacillus sp. 1_MG-2023 TaxID=3062655 RepID=UPI0026E2BB3B|nr:hypothetical protein [Anaerobacillus sp. 1_MG-2023]MDO6658747.1 hypothetical protein [Anaerobacillus sp. 1_MG-2023]